MIAARPLNPIFGWHAQILDIAQDVIDWFAAALAQEAPPLAFTGVDPEPDPPRPQPLGLVLRGGQVHYHPHGRGPWLAPGLLELLELAWNALPERWRLGFLGCCGWLWSWTPRPVELVGDIRGRLALAVVVAALVAAFVGQRWLSGWELVLVIGLAASAAGSWWCVRELAGVLTGPRRVRRLEPASKCVPVGGNS